MNNFPNFEPINISYKSEVDQILNFYPPHSDYNFVGLYDYDTQNDKMICRFEEGLAFVLNDYLTNQKFLSFIGHKNIDRKIRMLIEHSKAKYNSGKLKLIPEVVVSQIRNRNNMVITEDPDNFDYIIDLEEFIKLKGRKWHNVRKEIRYFMKNYSYEFVLIDLNLKEKQKEVEELFTTWLKQTQNPDAETELLATKRHLSFSGYPDCFTFGLYIDQKMVGYSMNQIIHNRYYVGHFGKTDKRYKGASRLMEYECAKFFQKRGCLYANLEQDLGIPGLRKMKRSLNPIFYIKKYDITMK